MLKLITLLMLISTSTIAGPFLDLSIGAIRNHHVSCDCTNLVDDNTAAFTGRAGWQWQLTKHVQLQTFYQHLSSTDIGDDRGIDGVFAGVRIE